MKSGFHKFYHKHINVDTLYANYKFIQEFQYKSAREISEFQVVTLKKLLEHASENVPYYKKLFTGFSFEVITEDFLQQFRKIPLLTKDIIRQNVTDLKAMNLPEKRFLKNSTSGSTGSNLIFYSDRNARIRQALDMQCNDWMGRKFGDRELKIWGASWDVSLVKKIIPGLKAKIKSSLVVSGYKLSDEDFKKYLSLLNSYKPFLLTSYPSILYAFANYIQKEGVVVRVNAVKSAGEKLHDFQRKLIEEVFQAKVYDFYGARDIPMVAMQCGHDSGLHLMAESVYMEVIDDQANPIEEGEGDLVFTDLQNFVFPFIRYKIGDRARISKRKCSCGRGLPLIEEVIGRSFDIVQFPNGNRVGGSFWTLVMRSVQGIKDFQVVQIESNYFSIRYIPENPDQPMDFEKLTQNIKEFGGNEIILDFELVDTIPQTKGGKHQFVISKK